MGATSDCLRFDPELMAGEGFYRDVEYTRHDGRKLDQGLTTSASSGCGGVSERPGCHGNGIPNRSTNGGKKIKKREKRTYDSGVHMAAGTGADSVQERGRSERSLK